MAVTMQPGATASATEDQGPKRERLVDWLLKEHTRLKGLREPWDTIHKEIYQHILPNMSLFYQTEETEGKRGDDKIFDNHGLMALRTLVLGLMGQAVSRNINWLEVVADEHGPRHSHAVRKYLRELTAAYYEIYRKSNFYHTIYEYIANAASVGTAGIYAEPDRENSRIVFKAFHPSEVYIGENQWGEVDRWHREFEWSARNIVSQFGAESVPEVVRFNAQDSQGNPDQEYTVVHAVYPSDEFVAGEAGPRGMPYKSYYILKDLSHLIRESGYRTKPAQFWRWYKLSGETYGRAPGFDALIDLKGLQQVSKSAIMLAQRLADPPMNIPSTLSGEAKLHPGAKNYYEDAGQVIQPVQIGGDYSVVIDQEERKKAAIDRHFMRDIFRTLSDIDRTMTATEVSQRIGENSVMIGPITSRMTTEGFDGLHERVFQLGMEMGLMPEPPDEILNRDIEFEYIGPLIQAQRKFYQLNGINTSLEQIAQIAQLGPEAAQAASMGIKWEELVSRIFDANNMDPEIMRSPREIQQMKQQMAEAQAQQEQQEQMKEMGDAMKGLNEQVKPGSPAEGLLGVNRSQR